MISKCQFLWCVRISFHLPTRKYGNLTSLMKITTHNSEIRLFETTKLPYLEKLPHDSLLVSTWRCMWLSRPSPEPMHQPIPPHGFGLMKITSYIFGYNNIKYLFSIKCREIGERQPNFTIQYRHSSKKMVVGRVPILPSELFVALLAPQYNTVGKLGGK